MKILAWLGGYSIPFDQTIFQKPRPKEKRWLKKEFDFISKMKSELIEKGAISKCMHAGNEFISSIFLELKSNGGFRLILNLQELNKLIYTQNFKLKDCWTAAKLLKQNFWMRKIDLKDAYHTEAICKNDREFLRFPFNNILYEFESLPFGHSTAPHVFTKVLKSVCALLQNKRIYCVIYLDDFSIPADMAEACRKALLYICQSIQNLGFVINWKKKHFQT